MDKKEAYLFCKFLRTEMKKIDEDKLYEKARHHKDPDQSYIVNWIQRNAAKWREEWESSDCKHCLYWDVCGHRARKNCSDFEFDVKENEEGEGD